MNLQQSIPLSDIYDCEEDFSADLADTLEALEVGEFEDVETEANVGTRRADIVAVGEDGILVVENQFGKADWAHWGRLEAYARLKEAMVAVLVAEAFDDLMIVTCNRRNEDSTIGWYLIKAQANSHNELSFHHVARPAIDIQVERNIGVEYSEFWAPIRKGELGELFAGKPVPVRRFDNRSTVRLTLIFSKTDAILNCDSRDLTEERRDEVMTYFQNQTTITNIGTQHSTH